MKSTSAVILLIAADDGVKPQTIEAIEYIKKIEAPVVVAVNKIDKAPDRLDDIKTQLSQYGIMPEDWGGDAIIVPISAKTGKNIDELLDMVNLQAEMLELKANKNIPAEGYVLESNMKKGRGVVATFLGQQGTLNVGDYFLCGNVKGRVTSLLSSSGKKLSKASVSEPVLISGFDGMPSAGDRLKIVSFAEYKKGEKSKAKSPIFGKFNFSESVVTNDFEYKNPEITFNLLVKADTDSSREAVCLSIEKLNKNIGSSVFKIISSGVGNITEGDISFADSIKAQIYGFGVKEDSQAKDIAKTKKVTVKNFNIIYKLSEDLESLYKENKKKQIIKEKVGSILIKKIFNIKGTGVIAGFVVQNGYVARESSVMIYRDKTCIGEGPLKSLQSDKKTVPKILSGREGAFLVDNFNDWVVGDQVEVYSVKKQ